MYKLSLAGALPDQMETQPIDVMTVATPQHKDNPISPQHSAVEKRMVFQSKGNVNPNGHGHEACLETPAKPVEITHENEDRKVGDKSHEKENNDENNKSDEKEPTHEKKKKKKDGKQKEIETNDTKRRQLRPVRRKMESSQKVTMRPGCCLKKNMFKLEGILVLVKNHMVETMLCLFSYVADGARRTCVHQVGPVKDSGQKARR